MWHTDEKETALVPVIRKTLLHVETTLIEGGKAAPTPLKLIAAIAVLKNPWPGVVSSTT
jgi:hypothetical protein